MAVVVKKKPPEDRVVPLTPVGARIQLKDGPKGTVIARRSAYTLLVALHGRAAPVFCSELAMDVLEAKEG